MNSITTVSQGPPKRGRGWKFATPAILLLCSMLVFAAGNGTIKGTVRAVATAGASSQAAVVPDAAVTLTNPAVSREPIIAVTDESGAYIISNVPAGDYVMTILGKGMAPISRKIRVESGALLVVDIDLNAAVSESVTVRDEEGLLSSSDVTTSNIVRGETIKEQPLRTDSYQNAIPLTPGAVRDGSGTDYIKGARSGASSYTVNGADVSDGSTGALAFEIPLEAASSVQVEENPYAANYGRFTGGVTNLQTKGGGDKFKITAARFFPAFHNILSTKIDSFRPRLTLSGPILKQKLYFLLSGEYRYSRIFVPSQPSPNNSSIQRSQSLFSQVDWNLNSKNAVKFTAAFFPATIQHVGLNTFDSAAVTPNAHQNGSLFTIADQTIFNGSSFLSSQVSFKTSGMNVAPNSTLGYNINPNGNTGGYFAETHRWNGRIEWQETYYLPHFNFVGEHSVTAGTEFYHTRISGQMTYRPINIYRANGTLAERVTFTRATSLRYEYSEADGFVDDKWVVSPKLTLDYGARLDRDGITHRDNVAPRFSLIAKPFGTKTTIRAGVGIFYDRPPAGAGYISDDDPIDPTAVFKRLPRRVITTYAADGKTVVDGPRLYRMRVMTPLLAPRSARWSVQLDRSITANLTARVGYTWRRTVHDLVVDRNVGTGTTGSFILSSKGRSSYDEFQSVMTYSSEKFGKWTGFYTYSRSRGDYNSGDLFFSDTPAVSVSANQYAPLPFDVPRRLMFYGEIEVSHKLGIRMSPLIELRSGSPYSALSERLEVVGARDSLRLPKYFSLDLQGTKSIKVPFLKDKRARVGLAVLNVTNHFNPREVQANITSS
ncbi:MAG TPA: carboxypeptidase regulatory-like domain-containing protein, partial [Pyrinomonadaceae bacterium]